MSHMPLERAIEILHEEQTRLERNTRLSNNQAPVAPALAVVLHEIGFLTFWRLRVTNLLRVSRWHAGGVKDWSLSDWVTATAGELGEAANVVKKLNRVRDGLRGNDKSEADLRVQLADELADTAIYLDLLAAAAGVDLGDAIRSKFNRTSEKVGFPERL